MNIREEIKKYNYYLAKIERLTMEIHELENQIINLKSPTIDGMPRAKGFSESKIEEKLIQNDEKITQKKQEIQRIRDILNILDALINTLKKDQRVIIKTRYVENADIQEIADGKYKEYRTIQKTIDVAINNMQESYDSMKST